MTDDLHTVVWFEIGVPDTAAAREFYGALFGWTFGRLEGYEPEYWLIGTRPGAAIQGALAPGVGTATDGNVGPLVYVAVADLAATLTRVAELGGTTAKEITAVGDRTYFAVARDPFGNRIGLWSSSVP
jgi:uncharacterized protein